MILFQKCYQNKNAVYISRPGYGIGGIICGVEWCDKVYVGKLLPGVDFAATDENGNETWEYHSESTTVIATFGNDGLIKNIQYYCSLD
jgi:hypothetical protein